MSRFGTFCAVQDLLLVYSAFVRAAFAVTVCGYRYLAVLCLGLLLRQFSRIFAVPQPITTDFAASTAFSSRTWLGQTGTIFFQIFLYSLFCDELPQSAYRKR